MSIITSDISINGKHGEILRKLIENGLFQNGAEGFVEASLRGIYAGRKSEADESSNEKITVSRTYWPKKPDLENILFTFLQHEKVYQGRALSAAEVFNINENTMDTKELIEELKEYALFGIEELADEYPDLLTNTNLETVIDEIINLEILLKDNLVKKAIEDEGMFFKASDDEEIEAILNG